MKQIQYNKKISFKDKTLKNNRKILIKTDKNYKKRKKNIPYRQNTDKI